MFNQWFAVVRSLVDYCIKAMAAYAETEQGQKEWSDVERAWEVAVNNDENTGTVAYSVERAQSAGPTEDQQVAPGVVRRAKSTA